MKLLVVLLSVFVGVADARDKNRHITLEDGGYRSGGGTIRETWSATRASEYLDFKGRLDLADILNKEEAKQIIPPQWSAKMLAKLVISVPHLYDGRDLREHGNRAMALAALHKISPEEIKSLAESRDFNDDEIRKNFSPIIFDIPLIAQVATSESLLPLMYYLHLTQLGLNPSDASEYVRKLSSFIAKQNR